MAASSPGSRPSPSGRACGPALTPAAGATPTQQAEPRIKIYNATRSTTTNLRSLRFQGIAGYSWAFTAAARTSPSREHYLRRRERGDGPPAALRHLFNRMLGQLHHCLRTGQNYDPIKAFPHTRPSATPPIEHAADVAA